MVKLTHDSPLKLHGVSFPLGCLERGHPGARLGMGWEEGERNAEEESVETMTLAKRKMATNSRKGLTYRPLSLPIVFYDIYKKTRFCPPLKN